MDETRDALTRKLQAFKGLGPEDLIMLRELQRQRSLIEAGREVVYEGQYPHSAYILREGWACSYKQLRDGSRQIIDIQIAGDFLGLRSLLLRSSDHSFLTITDVEVARLDRQRMLDDSVARQGLRWG